MSPENSRKFDTGKLVFLAILVAVLVLAAVAVSIRGRVSLRPVPQIPGSGLTLSLPQGSGWFCGNAGNWTQQEGSLSIRCANAANDCNIEVRYGIGPLTLEPREYIQAVAEALGLSAAEPRQINAADATIEWAGLLKGNRESGRCLGIARLGRHRFLSIMTHCAGDPTRAADLFRAVAESVRYSDQGVLDRGAELVAAVRQAGIAEPDWTEPAEDFYVVRGPGNRPVGLTVQVRKAFPQLGRVTAVELTIDRHGRKRYTSFVADGNLRRQLMWQTHPAYVAGGNMVRLNDGLMSITMRGTRRSEALLSDAASPEMTLSPILQRMLAARVADAAVDVLMPSGVIMPALIEVTGSPVADAPSARITFFGEEQAVLNLWLDQRGVIVRQAGLDGQTVIERMDPQTAFESFPQWRNDILNLMQDATHRLLLEHFDTTEKPETEAANDRSPV